MIAEKVNYKTIKNAFKVPKLSTEPYMPAKTYTKAVPNDTITLNNFSADFKSLRSFSTDESKVIIFEFATSSTIMFEVIKGDIPSSIKVPLLEARITLIQYRGSASDVLKTPYKGI